MVTLHTNKLTVTPWTCGPLPVVIFAISFPTPSASPGYFFFAINVTASSNSVYDIFRSVLLKMMN